MGFDEAVDGKWCIGKDIHFSVPLRGFFGERGPENENLRAQVVANQAIAGGTAVLSGAVCEHHKGISP